MTPASALLLALGALPFLLLSACSGAADRPPVRRDLLAVGAADLVAIAPFGAVAAGAGGRQQVRIDTRGSADTWIPCVRSGPGLLQAGRSYIITITGTVQELGADSYLLFLVRPASADHGNADLAVSRQENPGVVRQTRLRFTVPAGVADYALQIHTRRKVLAEIGRVEIEEGTGERILPVGEDHPPRDLPARLPVGASEFAIDLPRPASGATLSVAVCGADPEAADNTDAFVAAIARCAGEGIPRLVVPRGTYRFTSDRTLVFKGLRDFEFDGQGSTFVFLKQRGDLLRIDGCERVRFRDFAIDWDWGRDPLASTVVVEAVDPGRGWTDLRFVDHTDFPRRDVRVADLEQLDPATLSVGCEDALNASFEFYRGRSPVPRTEWRSGNLLRLHLDENHRGFAGRLRPGMPFRLRHYVYDMVGVAMRDNAHLTLAGVTVHSCPSHAFVSSGDQHHWQFLDTHVRPPAGSRRPITCTADHHHVGQSQGYFRMVGCEFALGGDDCLNVHDISGFAVKTAPDTVTTRNVRGIGSFHVGDPIELRQDDYAPSGCTATIAGVRTIDAGNGVHAITFAGAVPDPAGAGFVLFNRRYGTRQIVIRDCSFHDNRARALLLLGSDITVENNRFFHNQMGAIKIETGYTFDVWSEGYGASNIVIRGNTFDSVNPMGSYRNEMVPAIYMSVYLRRDPSVEKTTYPILRDILIEGNRFIDCPGAIAYACSVADVHIRGNTVVNRRPRRSELPYRGWIGAAYASNLFVSGNTWTASPLAPQPSVAADRETTSGIFSWDNRVVAP